MKASLFTAFNLSALALAIADDRSYLEVIIIQQFV